MASTDGTDSASGDGKVQDDYILTRDAAASARLNLSHYVWLHSYGYNLDPRVSEAIKGREDLKIADVGTGTGIWLLDLAARLPKTCHLDGIDISFDQCPPREWLPSNVTLRQVNVFDTLPEDLVEKYDVVHIRHFICIIKDNDPIPLFKNLLKMLKPGDWLQWGEWDNDRTHQLVKARPDLSTEIIDKLGAEFSIMRRRTANPTWPPVLDEYFVRAGMSDVGMEKRSSPLTHLPYMHDLTMLVFQELIDMAESKALVDGEKVKELRQLLGGAVKESRQGVA